MVITLEGGCIQHIETNNNCNILIIDTDNIAEGDAIGTYEPDSINEGQDIIKKYK